MVKKGGNDPRLVDRLAERLGALNLLYNWKEGNAPFSVNSWHLITGEYPPQSGGVSDYAALLATGLVGTGAEIHVWAPSLGKSVVSTNEAFVHRVAGSWSAHDLMRLSNDLNDFAPPRRLLVQYTPNAWGYRGLNFRFCTWLLERRKIGDDVQLMVHEPFYPWRLRDKPTRWFLAAGQRWMIRTLLKASSSVYVSIPGWESLLRRFETGNRRPITWLPICSTIPVVTDVEKVSHLRGRLAADGQMIIGSFGTFGGRIGEMVMQILPTLLLKHPRRIGLLIGRGCEPIARRLNKRYPQLANRLIALGGLTTELVSLHLQVCDLLVQPYPDGVSSRRTSVMAGLSHGIPTITTHGTLSESVWATTACVELVNVDDLSRFTAASEALLADPHSRSRLRERARATYLEHFALERTIEILLQT